MLNQVVIVGRIKSFDYETNRIYVAVPRSYKNENGEYDTDLIPVKIVIDNIWSNTTEYCKESDIIGVKGRLSRIDTDPDQTLSFIAEKITFLSSKKED